MDKRKIKGRKKNLRTRAYIRTGVLLAWMRENGMSIREFAKYSGVAYRTIWRLLNKYPANPQTIRRLSQATGIPIPKLIYR